MIYGFILAYNEVKRLNARANGFIIAVITCGMGFLINLLFGILTYVEHFSLHIEMAQSFPMIASVVFLLLNILLAIACFKISKFLTRFKGLAISFLILAVVAIVIYWLLMWFCESPSHMTLREMAINRYEEMQYDYYYESYMTKYPRLMVKEAPIYLYTILGVSMLTTLIFFWLTLRANPLKMKVKTKSSEDIEPIDIQDNIAGVKVSSVNDEHTQYVPKEEKAAPKPELSDDVVNLLMGYDNTRLKEIIEKPQRYNPAVVERAETLLCRRMAWEQIKDLSDNELLAMTMTPKGLYNESIVEAAAMELYQRDSQMLREQFMLMSPDVVSDIASGRTPVPEGIRLAARKYLTENS